MTNITTVRVHFIDGSERMVQATDIVFALKEGARQGKAIYEGRILPIYNDPAWGFLWYEQESVTRADVEEWRRQLQHEENERLSNLPSVREGKE